MNYAFFDVTLEAFVGSLVLSISFFAIYKSEKQKFLLDWTIAWLFFTTGYIFVSFSAYTGSRIFLTIGSEVFGLLHAFFLLRGTSKFIEKEFSKNWYFLISIVISWIFFSDFLKLPDRNLPQFLFFAFVHFRAGRLFLKTPSKGAGKYIAGFSLITWSIHKLDYPFLHGIPVFTEFGYLFSQFLALLTGIGVLIYFYEYNKRKLSLNEEKFNSMFENSPIPICTTTIEGMLTDVNKEYLKLFGYTNKVELVGRDSMELFFPDYRERLMESPPKKLPNGVKKYRTSALRKDGTTFPLEMELGKIKLPEGERGIAYLRDISELKKSEEKERKLKLENEKLVEGFRQQIDNMPVGYFLLDKNLRAEYLNPSAEKIFGYEKDELTDKNVFDLLVPDESKEIVNERAKRIRNNKDDINGINQNITKDKNIIYCEWKNSVIYDENGNLENVISVATDVTEKIYAQKKLEESERDYRQLFEEDLTGNIITKADGTIITCNSKMSKMLGFADREDFCNQNITSFYTDLTDRKNLFKKILENGKAEAIEFELIRKDGVVISVLGNAAARYDDNGTPYQFLGYFFDISEKKKVELELQAYRESLEQKIEERTKELLLSEDRFRNIAETSKDLIIKLDSEFRVDYVNNAVLSLINKDINEIIGKKVDAILTNSQAVKEILNKLNQVAIDKNPIELEIKHSDEIWVDYHLIPELENDDVKSLIAYGRDISRRKNLEVRIMEALEKEKEINEMKSAFVSMISHEFRTPLTALLSSVEILELYGRNWSEEKYNRHIDVIRRSVDNLTKMINDILFLNRAQAGKLELNTEMVNLYELIDDVIEECSYTASPEHVFNLNYKPERQYYNIDRTILRSVLSNLISNAVKYSAAGGKINVVIDENNSNLSIEVNDKGRGIESDELTQIFEPFARGKNLGGTPGTGLGLSIVKKALNLLKGNIEVKSELGYGSEFKVNLPLYGTYEKQIIDN